MCDKCECEQPVGVQKVMGSTPIGSQEFYFAKKNRFQNASLLMITLFFLGNLLILKVSILRPKKNTMANLMLGISLGWTSIPSKEGGE